jgi:hypothetical protein
MRCPQSFEEDGMRAFLTSSRRRLRTGWFWPLVLLALPSCILPAYEPSTKKLDPGPLPRTSAIMCDIPTVDSIDNVLCATDDEITGDAGVSLTGAAVALRNGQHKSIAFDYSPEALALCAGKPRKIVFQGTFPDGYTVCLNCQTQIPDHYVDSNAVCVAQCQDLIAFGESATPAAGTQAFCEANAHVSTNFDKTACFDNACSEGGTPLDFVDPRRTPENVKWVDFIGTEDNGNNLTRTAPTTGPSAENFDAGGASAQVITHGDGWVEFEAKETNLSHVLGLSSTPCYPCNDTDPGLNDIQFGISLNFDGHVYLIQSGTLLIGPEADQSFGTYQANEKFRVHVVDNHDKTATISYTRVIEPCTIGSECTEDVLATETATFPEYPFRVDASFREQDATLQNVTLVRIQ